MENTVLKGKKRKQLKWQTRPDCFSCFFLKNRQTETNNKTTAVKINQTQQKQTKMMHVAVLQPFLSKQKFLFLLEKRGKQNGLEEAEGEVNTVKKIVAKNKTLNISFN